MRENVTMLPVEQEAPGDVVTRRPLLPADSVVPVYVGAAVVAAGLAVVAFAWSRVAGQTVVALQLPYLVSGGFAGLGLVAVGLAVVSTAVKRRDAVQRDERLDRLADVLATLARTLDAGDGRDREGVA